MEGASFISAGNLSIEVDPLEPAEIGQVAMSRSESHRIGLPINQKTPLKDPFDGEKVSPKAYFRK